MTTQNSSVDLWSTICKEDISISHTLEDFIFCKRIKIEERWEKSAIAFVYVSFWSQRIAKRCAPNSLKIFIVIGRTGLNSIEWRDKLIETVVNVKTLVILRKPAFIDVVELASSIRQNGCLYSVLKCWHEASRSHTRQGTPHITRGCTTPANYSTYIRVVVPYSYILLMFTTEMSTP